MSFDPRARKELVFAEIGIIYSGLGYPLTAESLNRSFAIYQRDLFWDGSSPYNGGYLWSDFLEHCLIQVKGTMVGSGSEIFRSKPQRFSTTQDFLDFINDNFPNNGFSFSADGQMKVFNKIEHGATSINRLNSQNTFYAVLNATSRLTHNSSLMAIDTERWGASNYKSFIKNAWLNLWGITVSDSEYDSNVDNWRGTMWVQNRKTRNLYNLPAVNRNISIKVGSHDTGRRSIIEGNPHIIETPDPVDEFRIIKKVPVFLNQSDMSIHWNENQFRMTQLAQPYSGIMLYGIQRGENKAIYIKPLGGIDSICVPKFDQSIYRLEAMYSAPQHKDKFRIVSVNMGYSMTYSSWINKDKFWLGGTGNARWKNATVKDIGRNIRFYLRKLNTNLVTPVSRVYIKAVRSADKSAQSGIDFLVETDKG